MAANLFQHPDSDSATIKALNDESRAFELSLAHGLALAGVKVEKTSAAEAQSAPVAPAPRQS